MKTSRARSNHRSKKPAKQVQPKPERMIIIVLFSADTEFLVDPEENFLLDQFQLPEPIFKRIQCAAKEAGIKLDEFITRAIREKISRDITADSSAILDAIHCPGGAL